MTDSVSSKDTNKFAIAAFFSGVGGIELGFEQTNKFRVVYANEFDKNANITYRLNFPKTFLDNRDIHIVQPEDIKADSLDVIVGGFPCQAFSIAGYRKGFKDERGDLFFELLRIIQAKKPKAIFIENVKNMVSHDHGKTFKVIKEALTTNGYHIKWKVLNGKDYGNIPQNRERIYIVGFLSKAQFDSFSFPNEIKLTSKLSDVIEFNSEQDDYFYYSAEKNPTFYKELQENIKSSDSIYQWRRQYVRENKSGVVPTLTANMGMGGHNVPLILTQDKRIRKLTPKETFNVQGYPKDFKLPKEVSNGQLYKQAGNSVVVPLIKRIALEIAHSLHIKVKDSNKIIKSNVLLYTCMNGRYDGEAYLVETSDSITELKKYVDNVNKVRSMTKEPVIDIYSDEEYLKFVGKNKKGEFYSIVNL
jgi:DNA (cytosine-5-)-methyltransferase